MSPTRTRASLSASPTSPGSRWWSGAMALNRWVTQVAPWSTAFAAWSRVAGVCPSDTTTPRCTSSAITGSTPGRSGASVTTRDTRLARPPLDGLQRRGSQQRLRVGAPLGRRQERPLQVQAEGDGAPPAFRRAGGQRLQRSVDDAVGCRHDGRQPCRHPDLGQPRAEIPQPLRRSREVDPEPPVALQIDEPGRREQPSRRPRPRHRRPPARRRRRRRAPRGPSATHAPSTSTSAPRTISSVTTRCSLAGLRRGTLGPSPGRG